MPLQAVEAASISSIGEQLKRLQTLREELCLERAGIQYQSELLSHEIAEALEELRSVIDSLPADFEDRYKSLLEWHETLSRRAQAIRQTEDNVKPREAELNQADADFVVAAERQACQPFIASDNVRQPYPLLLEMFNARESTCQILAEQIAELEWEHDENLIWRDIQRDQDVEIEMADDDFQLQYLNARTTLEAELVQAQQERSALEAGCRAQGFDMTGRRYISLAEISPPESHQQREDSFAIPPALEAFDNFPSHSLEWLNGAEEESPQHSGSIGDRMDVGNVAGWLEDTQRAAMTSDTQHRRSRSESSVDEPDRQGQQKERLRQNSR